MESPIRRPYARYVSRTVRVIMLFVLASLGLAGIAGPAQAAGSRNITQGYRPFIEWHASATTGGIPRKTTIRAFAHAGEQIFIGSSAMGVTSPTQGTRGNVIFHGPDGTTGDCLTKGGGLIANRVQEQAGTIADDPANGFVPCVISATQTTNAKDGIWDFDFISPNPNSNINLNPTPLLANAPAWTQDNDHHWINAWHVSVRNAANVDVPGRVFAKYLAYNMGSNGVGLDAPYWIITNDGYGYKMNMNGIDPFGFIFFSNAEGVVDASGNPIYRSLQLNGGNLPAGYSIHIHNPPLDPDNIALGNITHKIFFEEPDKTMPAAARAPDGDTWLLPVTVNPAPQNFTFTGVEGTPNQAGTAPLGGNFAFDFTSGANYRIIVDVNANGIYGDGNDRVLTGRAFDGHNVVFWDARDANGVPVPAGPQLYDATIQISVGEVHFPFIDAENNIRGIQLSRYRGGQAAANTDLIYYNDTYNYTGANVYDYSLCATAETPAPPTGSCYGTPPAQRSALSGVHSAASGAHLWSNSFGDQRVIDTWAYFSSDPVHLVGTFALAQAELSIIKTHSPAQLIPGQALTYTLKVKNAGPSRAVGAQVTDNVPALVHNPTWTCAITAGTGTCNGTSGSGNTINTTVTLDANSEATYLVQGVLDSGAVGSMTNKATVRRPNDNTDPDLSNNSAQDIAPILAVADLELNKTISTPPASLVVGGPVNFTIELRNRGPAPATGVEVSEPLPAGLTFSSASTLAGSYSSATGIWAVGTIAPNTVATLTLTAIWNGSAVKNTAEVSKSDQFDPDSTPGNGAAGEDDQSSAALPMTISDLSLTKHVSAPRVNVGSNVVFTIDVTNHGPNNATGVRVSERLPVGLALVSALPSQGVYDAVSGSWAVGSLANGAAASLQITATVLGHGPFTNVAQISSSDQYDPNSNPNNDNPGEDDQGSASVTGDIADLSLTKVVDNPTPNVGAEVVFTVAVANSGPSDATGVAVSEPLPAGLALVQATPSRGTYDPASGAWVIGAVNFGEVVTLKLRVRLTGVGPYTNTAEISTSDQPDPNSTPGDGKSGEDDTGTVTIGGAMADLALAKRVNTTVIPPSGIVDYTIEVVNNGPSPATGVAVAERLPAGATLVAPTTAKGSYDAPSATWTLGGLAVGERATLNLSVHLSGPGPFINTAEISTSDQPDPNSTPGNGVIGENDQASATVGLGLAPLSADLELTKTATALAKLPNSASYLITVVNKGPDAATNVEVSERLPAGLAFISATPSQGSYNLAAGTWTIGTIPNGAAVTLQIITLIATDANIINTAEVSKSDQPDPDSTPGNGVVGEDDQASVSFNRLTAITLTSFSADRQAKGVQLRWTTGSELRTLGFQIYRSASASRADAVLLTPQLILARGVGGGGASYSFLDPGGVAGASDSYWLVERESGGGTSEFGPTRPASISAGPYQAFLPIVLR